MSPLTLTPNAEKVVADYLRTHEDVAAITNRIVSETPKSTDTPWVRYTQLNEPDIVRPLDYAVKPYIQLDCYAGRTGGQPEASLLKRTVRAALVAMPDADDVDDAEISDVEIRGDSRLPDSQMADRERFILTFTVVMRPKRS